jgi:antibiotic biosynthesis monooxygenase (ABM) superfamily enzyme
MPHSQSELGSQDDHGWDAWFEDEIEPPVAPRRWRFARYIWMGIAVEAIILVVALAAT